ncbi:MAG: FHA domain-containing protein, partial [Granulosicoccus sp.]|nr:FHA domain-containing protein [Granulosicoccus sp.]
MFDFYYQQGNSRRKLFQVKGGHCSIGSARSNDLIIDTRLMSKRHAELRLEHDGLHLRDLGSLSGTWVNRERILDHGPLSDLDDIEVGDLNLAIRVPRVTDLRNGRTTGNGAVTPLVPSVLPPAGAPAGVPAGVSAGVSAGVPAETRDPRSSSALLAASAAATTAGSQLDNPPPNNALTGLVQHVLAGAEFDQAHAYWGRVVHEQLLY